MTENLEIGLQLLFVGMVSVFAILGFVVVVGKILILSVNKFAGTDNTPSLPKVKSLDNRHVAVLTSVVNLVTQGKGEINSIKKIK